MSDLNGSLRVYSIQFSSLDTHHCLINLIRCKRGISVKRIFLMLFKWHREAGVLGAEWTLYKPQGWAGLLQASAPVGSGLHLGNEVETNPRTRGKYAILSSLPAVILTTQTT